MRWLVVVVALAVSVVVAFANPRGRRGGGGGAMFPMATADFKKLADGRFVMFKLRLEDKMKEAKVADAKREAARKQAATLQADVQKKIDQVGADKTITRPEAMEVRELDVKGRLAIWKSVGITPPPPPQRRGGGDGD